MPAGSRTVASTAATSVVKLWSAIVLCVSGSVSGQLTHCAGTGHIDMTAVTAVAVTAHLQLVTPTDDSYCYFY